MKPLIVLLSVFVAVAAAFRVATGVWHADFAGNLAMALMLFFASIAHFVFTRGMTMMLPPFVPGKRLFVYATGIAEILLGGALLVPDMREAAGGLLVLLFILLLPANVYAAAKRINLEKADYTGPGWAYLWFRVPLQLFFIVWVCYFSLGLRG